MAIIGGALSAGIVSAHGIATALVVFPTGTLYVAKLVRDRHHAD